MRVHRIYKGNAGLTMVELMITAAIFSGSMVFLSGSMVTFASHNTMSEQEAVTTSYNRSVFEDMRGRGLVGLLNYDLPVDDPDLGTVFIPGMGDAYVNIWAILPQEYYVDGGQTPEYVYDRWFLVGYDDPATVLDPPNPIEVYVEVFKASGAGNQHYYGSGGHYKSSTMIGY